MPRSMKIRLSVMMFLEYFVPGTTLPIMSLYLKQSLGFEPYQAGMVLAMTALAATVAPLAASHMADRYIASERLLALCHLCCGALMLLLWWLESFSAVLCVYFLYGVCFTPTFGLTNAVALHHVRDARRDFGGIRMWGTASWVVVAWTFGYFWLGGGVTPGERLPHALLLSGLTSFALSIYAMSFRPAASGPDGAAGAPRAGYGAVLRMFMRPGMVLLCALTLLNSACHQFYYYGMSPYLHQMGFSDKMIMPSMSVGQMSEVLVLGLLGWFLTRITMKRALVIGVLAQAGRLLVFAMAGPAAIIVCGIALHGVCYAFFFTVAYLYVEQHSTRETRAGAQQVLTMVITGAGTLAGSLGAGYAAQWLSYDAGLVDWTRFWTIPALMALFISLAIALFFREEVPAIPPGAVSAALTGDKAAE